MTLGHVDLHPIFAFRTEYSVAEPLVIIGHQQDRYIDTRSVHLGDDGICGAVNVGNQRYLLWLMVSDSGCVVGDVSDLWVSLGR